ncbi:MAG: AAA family ATPase [Propionibacteriaceae bacterium]|jgi:pilus assembly protein CpaE|nr:AAA family ATPase [Propionibacteriaceae bacterium]
MSALVVSRNPRVVSLVQQSWGPDAYALAADPFPPSVQSLMSELEGAPFPTVAVLDPVEWMQDGLSLAADLDQSFGVPVVLVTDRANELGLAAMRAGVRDIVHPMAPLEEMKQALERAASHAASEGPQPGAPGAAAPQRGKVVTVASPKGGVGKTTVSTNLAVGLAMREPNSTVLVDLDIHFGDVATALNVAPEFTLPDMAHGPASRDSVALKSYLTQHQTGLFVVPGSDSPAAADAVSPKEAGNLLNMLADQFKFVVVDTSPGLSEHTLSVLDQTDILVLVTSLDVPGVRGLRKELDTLRDISIVLDSRAVVLNFMHPSRGISVADVEASIGRKVDLQLPQSNAVPISVNQGKPLLQQGSRDPVAKQLKALVDLVAAGDEVQAKGRRFLDFAKKGDKS